MRRTELITRIFLIAIIAVAAVAIVLQIMNEKTNALETTYEIITFSAALTCVIAVVLQGVVNERTMREMGKIMHEVRELMDEMKHNEQRDIAFEKAVEKDLKTISSHELEMTDEQEK